MYIYDVHYTWRVIVNIQFYHLDSLYLADIVDSRNVIFGMISEEGRLLLGGSILLLID